MTGIEHWGLWSSTHTTFEHEATQRMSPSAPAPHPLPRAHKLVIQPQVQVQPQIASQPMCLPNVQQLMPTLASVAPSTPAPYAIATAIQAPHMVLYTANSSPIRRSWATVRLPVPEYYPHSLRHHLKPIHLYYTIWLTERQARKL